LLNFIEYSIKERLKSRTLFILLLFALFLISGLITAYISFQRESPSSIAERISLNLKHELQIVEADAQQVLNDLQDTIIVASEDACPFFLYDRGRLVQWTNNEWIPPVSIFSDTFDIMLVHDGNTDQLVRRWQVDKNRSLVSVIPLQKSFRITNEYISQEWNTNIFPTGNVRILEPTANLGVPVCVDGRCFFRISYIPDKVPSHSQMRMTSCILLSIGLIILVVLIYRGLPVVTRRFPELGILYLYVCLGGIRFLMVETNFPVVLIDLELFNPQIFAASSINASLGDLMLNMIVVLAMCYFVFRNYRRFWIFHRYKNTHVISLSLSIFYGLCFLFSFLFPFITVQTLYNNSAIPLSIAESLDFNTIRIIAFFAVMLSGACAFLFAHAAIRMMVGDKGRKRILISFGASMLLFVLINEISGQQYVAVLIIGFLYFLTIYFLKLYNRLNRFQYATFAYLFVGVFYLCSSAAYAIIYFGRQEKIESQFRFARNFLIDRDYFGEYLLREVSQKVVADLFIQSRMTSAFLGKDAIRQKIRQVFLPSYFNKYDVQIMLFDGGGDAMDNNAQRTFGEYVNFYEQEAFRTEYNGIFFVNNPQADVTQKYIVIIPVGKSNIITGYIIIELALKRIIPDNVYPELLVDNRFQEFYRTQELSYAVMASKTIQFTSGNFNYDRFNLDWLGNPELYTKGIRYEGVDHIAQEDQNGRVAVVSTLDLSVARKFAAFSFLFVAGMAVILTVLLIQGLINYGNGNNLFFSARIQLIMNLAFFLPLIMISVTTLSLTSRSSQQQLDEEYRNKAKSFAQQLSNNIVRQETDQIPYLGEHLTDLALLSNLDANLYTTSGQLRASSQPLIVESGLISNYINPSTLHKIRNGENLFTEQERIGKLTYFVAYSALKSPITGSLYGILGIPFFQSGYSLEKAQITILANILNIFAGIFIVLLVLSYFVSRWLTFPLTVITQSLKRTSLDKTNQPLTWQANDEIGLMAKEYNQMLFKLSESKAELEQTQREKAWREIAQQVAHEIKNPLTPMKLTLQQLERIVKQGTPSPEKVEKSVLALLTQVDTLNDIASSFSSFAKMPEPVIQRLELVSLIRRIVELHSQSVEIHFTPSVKELFVMADEQLLGRTFSNLIINAIQAARPGVSSRILITLQRDQSHCTIKFNDNGRGMTEDVASSVFVPHFTTKRSGSGLGLAIARQGIEQLKGKIWFETTPGQGTTFFISLPI
jgi:two-component system, NtrC family, nitrogen regulation sensor histidine kinase NtrY